MLDLRDDSRDRVNLHGIHTLRLMAVPKMAIFDPSFELKKHQKTRHGHRFFVKNTRRCSDTERPCVGRRVALCSFQS